jgi:hypothetical protein
VDLLHHGEMEVFRKVPLLASAHQPRQRQGAPFVDYMDHESDTPLAYDTPIYDQHKRLQSQMRQQDLRIGGKIHFRCDLVVPQPPGKAFDAALWLGTSGYVRRDFRQLGALAGHNAADQRGQSGDVPGHTAGRFSWVPL